MQQRKGGKLNRCLEIMKLLETYSQELLKMDVKISQGEEVNQFFRAQTQDLDPSFPENRYEMRVIFFLFVKVLWDRRETQFTLQASSAGCFNPR